MTKDYKVAPELLERVEDNNIKVAVEKEFESNDPYSTFMKTRIKNDVEDLTDFFQNDPIKLRWFLEIWFKMDSAADYHFGDAEFKERLNELSEKDLAEYGLLFFNLRHEFLLKSKRFEELKESKEPFIEK